MINPIDTVEKLTLAKITGIPGLVFRRFRGDEDFPKMLNVIHGCKEVDGLERAENLEDIRNNYSHLVHCDPYQDMLIADVEDELVGYSRVWWDLEGSGNWIGFHFGNVLPAWRRKGIGSALLSFNECRLRLIAKQLKMNGELPVNAPCMLDVFISSSETARMNLLERHGYTPVRYAYDMVRPDLENIPDLPLPPGVEIRPVKTEQLRSIWEASNEAFRDHWGYIPDPWEVFQSFIDSPDYDPSIFRVAWQGDQIAGMVLGYIDKDENELYGRKRGYTENICVRRPWRRQGLAKALIASSLLALKERGMNEAGLGVDTENTSGALHLYEFMGFRAVKCNTNYRKKLDV